MPPNLRSNNDVNSSTKLIHNLKQNQSQGNSRKWAKKHETNSRKLNFQPKQRTLREAYKWLIKVKTSFNRLQV